MYTIITLYRVYFLNIYFKYNFVGYLRAKSFFLKVILIIPRRRYELQSEIINKWQITDDNVECKKLYTSAKKTLRDKSTTENVNSDDEKINIYPYLRYIYSQKPITLFATYFFDFMMCILLPYADKTYNILL